MNIYKISQEYNWEWDVYSSAIVIAESEEAAKLIHPDVDVSWNGTEWVYDDTEEYYGSSYPNLNWCHTDKVKVELICTTTDDIAQTVISTDYHSSDG